MKCGTVLIALSLSLSWLPAAGALSQDVGPWRALTAEEERARIGDTPAQSIDPSMIEGDFDGDGTKDKALIAIRKSDGVFGLIAILKSRIHVLDTDLVEPSDGLGYAKPGTWKTICGIANRASDDESCKEYPSRVTLKNPGILWIGNGRTLLYFWDKKTRRFDVVLMVD